MLRNKLGYLVIIIFTGIFSVLYNDYIIGIIFLVVLTLPIILMGIAILTSYYIKVELKTTTPVVGKGERIDLTIHLNNASIFPVTKLGIILFYYNQITQEVEKENIQVVLEPKGSKKVSLQITSPHCGNLIFKIRKWYIYDLLSLSSVTKKVNQSILVSVMPEIYEISRDIIQTNYNKSNSSDSDQFAKHKPGNDPSEVFGIREYREGDRPNHIHWKLSYKKDQLMIKEFSEPINESIGIFFDVFCGEKEGKILNYVDGLLECIMSVSYNCLKYAHNHKLISCDTKPEHTKQYVITNEEERFAALNVLLNVNIMTVQESIIKNYYQNNMEDFTHIIYIAAKPVKEDINYWLDKNKGTQLLFLYVNDLTIHPLSSEVKGLLQDYQVLVYELDIRHMEEGLMNM